MLSCTLIALASAVSAQAANGIIDTTQVNLCAGDELTLTLSDNKNVKVYTDTIVYDTIHVANTTDDSIHMYVARVMPTYLIVEPTRIIQNGGSFVWHDTTITTEGTYERVYKSHQYDCDSTYRVTVYRMFIYDENRRICQGDSTEWRGQICRFQGTYTDVVRSRDGLRDSILYRLNLEVKYVEDTYINRTICRGSWLDWRNQRLTEQGVYTDTLKSTDLGCDSIVHLTLNIQDVDTVVQIFRLTESETYTWMGKEYTQAGVYDTLLRNSNPMGCDTVARLYLSTLPIDTIDTVAVICRGEEFEWHGITANRSGDYYRAEKPTDYSQTIYHLNLTIRNIPETDIRKYICTGGSLEFLGKTYTKAGVYRDTVKTDNGCDSVLRITISEMYPEVSTTVTRIAEGQTYTWNGKQYTEAGTYDSIKSREFGCDSIARLILITYHVDTIDTVATICPNTSIMWHGMVCSETKRYEFPSYKENGDLVYYRLDLTVRELQEKAIRFKICDNETVTFNGVEYRSAGVYYDRSVCDTVYTITVEKYPSTTHFTRDTSVADAPYYWRWQDENGIYIVDTITASGQYTHIYQNAETGCNEIWKLELELRKKDQTTYRFDLDTIICENEYFEWRGRKSLNRQGIGTWTEYWDNLTTRTGMDSIYHLRLFVTPVPRSSRTIPFCGSIVWNGVTYTESAYIVDTFTSVNYNCDSIVTTILTKGVPFHKHDTATITPGEVLIWRGQTITQDGEYSERHTTAFGCDSIYTLGVGLREIAPVTNTRSWKESICEGDYKEWNGKKYYNSGTYVDTIWNAQDPLVIDSLLILQLTVNPKYAWSEHVTFTSFPTRYRDQEITGPGTYTVRYTSSLGCDSIITVYVDRQVIRDEISATICPGETYQWRGHEYAESYRYIETEKAADGVQDSVEHILNLTVKYIPETRITEYICRGGSYTFGNQTYTETGVYRHVFHDTGCDSVVILSLNVLNTDTNRFVHHMSENESYEWNNQIYKTTGTYFHYATNRFGCDSINVLELTVNKVDTVDSTVVVCPNEIPFFWHGIRANQTGDYHIAERQDNGDYNFYRLHLTVRDLHYIDTIFTICDDESLTFNGKTYTESGIFFDYLSCDTIIRVRINKHPQQVYATVASLGGEHGYTWTYMKDGVETTTTFNEPGTYEFESPNATTGCSELWRLILVENLQPYYFEETLTICEGEQFTWHGMSGLSHQYIGQTHDYTAEYKTRTGQDSIYTLHLTVKPIQRSYQTIVFCGEIDWKGVRYTQSAVVNDTLTSSTGCDSIVRVNLDKATPFYSYQSRELPQGEVLHWHGFEIFTDGVYRDVNTTANGCDSIYELKVTIIPATPQSNQYAEELSACQGDTILWRGKNIWAGGTYVDTVWTAGREKVDSIFTLRFTVWPAPKDTNFVHLYTCGQDASIYYQGKEYTQNDTIINNLHTIHGCDSIVKVYLHFNTALYLSDTVEIADTQLPYTWHYRLSGTARDTVLTTAGTYLHTEPAEGSCENKEELVLIVYPTYLYELDTTICETALPFYWLNGPQDKVTNAIQHEIGTTKQYEYRYTTVYHTDSIYRLNLTIDPAPHATEYYYVCSGTPEIIRGKTYGNSTDETDRVYRDTVTASDPNGQCDSIIYVEVYVSSLKQYTETRILHLDETINWNNYAITQGGDYRDTVKTANGCDSVSVLHVVQETRKHDRVCELDLPYIWDKNGQPYSSSGIWEHTETEPTTGNIIGYYTLYLSIDTVPSRVEQHYVCYGHPQIINGKQYGALGTASDTLYHDTIPDRPSPSMCDSVIYLEIFVSSETVHEQTVILHEGETYTWFGREITELATKTYDTVTTDPVTGCEITHYLHVVAEHRDIITICSLDTATFVWSFNGKQYTTTGIYTDTVFDANGYIEQFHTLDLRVKVPVDTTIYINGCFDKGGVTFLDKVYLNDTTIRDTLQCDTMYTAHIRVFRTDTVYVNDTVCETQLPYIFGKQNPDTIWEEHVDPIIHIDTTACGCDSVIYLTLRITPTLGHNDSTFRCEDDIMDNPVVLGNLTDPWFDTREGGIYLRT